MEKNKKENIKNKKEYYRKIRKTKKEKYKKTERLYCRLTEMEYDFLKQNAEEAGITITDFVVESCLYSQINIIEFNDLISLTNAISKYGNNVNQIARSLNILIKKDVLNISELHEIKSELCKMQELYTSLSDLNSMHWKQLNDVIIKTEKINAFNNEDE